MLIFYSIDIIFSGNIIASTKRTELMISALTLILSKFNALVIDILESKFVNLVKISHEEHHLTFVFMNGSTQKVILNYQYILKIKKVKDKNDILTDDAFFKYLFDIFLKIQFFYERPACL